MPQRVISANEHEELFWNVERLWALSEGLPIERIPLEHFEQVLSSKLWFGPDGLTFRAFVDRVRAVTEVDLSYPIIPAAEGWIMDGRTRLQKALLLGHKDIAAVRFPDTPEPDERVSKNNT